MSLQERLDKIRSSPNLQSQQQTAVVLNAIEDTLQQQNSPRTPTAYFAALLSLLSQYISHDKGIVTKDVAYAVVYLLDLVTSQVPPPLLKSKFPQIIASLWPALLHPEAEAPLLRAAIGCLESLLIAQDSQAWAQPQSNSSPRGAVGALLALAVDHRPKVRRRAHDAITNVLKHPPPSPILDHPAAELCAETALRSLQAAVEEATGRVKKHKSADRLKEHDPNLLHALQLVKTIASAANGWPTKKLDALVGLLLDISRGSNEFLTMAAFEVFEIIFASLTDVVSGAKLPRLLEAIRELQPSQNDTQLLPPWIAVLSRGYDVSAQVEPEETFQKLPAVFELVASFLPSPSHNIRVSASECLISLLNTCIPDQVILDPSIMDDKILESIARTLKDLLSVKYQTAWMEVFNVLSSAFEVLIWRAHPLLSNIVASIGELRSTVTFAGKKEADAVLSAALKSMGPDNVLSILPLNLSPQAAKKGPGRAWLLPLMRDSVMNTSLGHFRKELVLLSQVMFQRVIDHGEKEKTMEIKIFETVVAQIWACLPGYCQLPIDLREAFDQDFAEMLGNLLYQQPHLRTDICNGLENLVESNKAISELQIETGAAEDLIRQGRVTIQEAKDNLSFLAGYSGNLLAVLFNVYSQTLPKYRGKLLQCINAYLSITPKQELVETFERVAGMLEQSLTEAKPLTQAERQKQSSQGYEQNANQMPPTSHTLMDLTITISIYLPRESFAALFNMAANVVNRPDDQQLQKKAYKLIPRLAECEVGTQAIKERNVELQQLLINAAAKASSPAKRDRLASIACIVPDLPKDDLHFIPSILGEVVISAKEVNEKARMQAFELLVLFGEKMAEGGRVVNSRTPHMSSDAPDADASLEEYFTMVSAGLAGSTPHMISASIIALTRLLFEFRDKLKHEVVADLVQTMDLFLTSPSREIVQSVLGFVKVCITSLSDDLIRPRLDSLVKNLIHWSNQPKTPFRSKVKHILERMIRRFGVNEIEKRTPESDKKLITNIRKTKERRKRKKDLTAAEDESSARREERKGRFESEYDEAIYGSESDESDISDEETLARAAAKGSRSKASGQQYIVEDDDEPLDLLDRKALAKISSTKPAKRRLPAEGERRTKAKTDMDGKLVFNDVADSDDDAMIFDESGMINGREPGDGTLEGGINAYIDAIKSKDAGRRGQRGKLKFKNARDEKEDEMDLDDEDTAAVRGKLGQSPRDNRNIGKKAPARRGLGMDKQRGPSQYGVKKARGGKFVKARRGGRR